MYVWLSNNSRISECKNRLDLEIYRLEKKATIKLKKNMIKY